MILESYRWGEAYYHWSDGDTMACALPVMVNQLIIGGVILEAHFDQEETHSNDPAPITLLQPWSDGVRISMEKNHWINLALMREHAHKAKTDRFRGEALHRLKTKAFVHLREVYCHLEPELFMAMRKGERHEARRMLNHVLTHIYAYSENNLTTIKTLILDLVTMMRRTVVECGADPACIMGESLHPLDSLRTIDDEENLSHWVTATLEDLINEVEQLHQPTEDMRIPLAINYLHQHCDEALQRAEVATKVGLSADHFSRLLKASAGCGFGELLRRIRIEKSIRLLRQTQRGILDIALECGFQDQSYFTKVFKQTMGTTPGDYRKNVGKPPTNPVKLPT